MRASKKSTEHKDGFLYKMFKQVYGPFLMSNWVRPLTMISFFAWFCFSVACLPKIEVGLNQEISMPDDSFVLKYFESLKTYLSVGPPFYIVLNSSDPNFDFALPAYQNRICGTAGCDPDSLASKVKQWSSRPERTFVASPAQSWLDDYLSWMTNPQCCSFDPETLQVCQSNRPRPSGKTSNESL